MPLCLLAGVIEGHCSDCHDLAGARGHGSQQTCEEQMRTVRGTASAVHDPCAQEDLASTGRRTASPPTGPPAPFRSMQSKELAADSYSSFHYWRQSPPALLMVEDIE